MRIPAQACAQMLDAHPDAHWLIDEMGVLTHANRAALRLMGSPAGDILGVHIDHLVADGPEHCAAVLRQGRRSTVPTPARLRLRTSGGDELPCRCEIALLSPAAEGVPSQLWCRLLPQRLGNSQFEVLNHQIAALRLEVGRRQAAESEMRQQREWLQAVLLGIAEGVVATDLDGCVLLMNPAAADLTGWTLAQSLRRPINALVRLTDESDLDTAEDPVGCILRGSGSGRDQRRLRLVARDGTEHLVQASASALLDEGGQLCGAVLVLRSIDEEVRAELKRRALEHQLRQAQKMEAIGTLAGGVAHDFNNVIGSVIANAALARMELPTDHTAQQPLLQIHRAGDRARALVRQILAFSRQDPQRRERHWLQPLVEEAVGLLRGTLPARVRLEVQCVVKPVHALVDAMQFQQVVMNLCTNAWHALSAGGGDVTVALDLEPACASQGPMARLRVTDDGCGMDEATRERIFEPFFTTKPTGEGTGLGLSVVHGIVAEHQGSLQAESSPGQGSTFTVRLPALVDDMQTTPDLVPPPSELALEESSSGGNERHVAYVDDDESMRNVIERLLRRKGYRVSSYESAELALAALELPATSWDVVVTDFNMPRTSGLDLARELRRLRPMLPVVITSGYVTDELQQGSEALGHTRLLNKEDCFECIGSLLAEVLGA
ncbi:PAS domain-containing hybrid sensor histidine kinase/response regulator [Hydrogenophaga sp. PBL-H3]|uniref:PAS domain-containing hybrid sensor histidine kinase/response regulator n=1 Tax=Hydrogenophaga sp. PBL-H3 TaxID=434010 RepID=UPI00131F7D06|nr:ATP-binding protein [Hydrogenophaga sp. PBL-H3]QHE77752.1 PAS domain-containing protein [Hydrogenophaga sp. PBL-H3]QHE82176.1 PAS domain-containing protein [Hydrogenophaga sp. PBL-H3]